MHIFLNIWKKFNSYWLKCEYFFDIKIQKKISVTAVKKPCYQIFLVFKFLLGKNGFHLVILLMSSLGKNKKFPKAKIFYLGIMDILKFSLGKNGFHLGKKALIKGFFFHRTFACKKTFFLKVLKSHLGIYQKKFHEKWVSQNSDISSFIKEKPAAGRKFWKIRLLLLNKIG